MTAAASAIVAAFAPWHESHEGAAERLCEVQDLVAHAELEAYSVLTRLPPELRASGTVVAESLEAEFPGDRLVLPDDARGVLVRRLAGRGLTGSRVYDALIAATAVAHGESLVSCDRRAAPTYLSLGIEAELL